MFGKPPPNSRARSGTVSLAIVHRQADKHCSLTRELKVPPIHFVAEGHLTTLWPRKHWGCVLASPPLLFALQKIGEVGRSPGGV